MAEPISNLLAGMPGHVRSVIGLKSGLLVSADEIVVARRQLLFWWGGHPESPVDTEMSVGLLEGRGVGHPPC